MIQLMRILTDEVPRSILGFDTEHSDWGISWHLKLGYDSFLPHPGQFIIQPANWHYTERPRNKRSKLEDECYASKQWKYFVLNGLGNTSVMN
jgi:hypothetical protein